MVTHVNSHTTLHDILFGSACINKPLYIISSSRKRFQNWYMRLRRNHTDHLFIYASVRKKLVQGTIVLTLKKKNANSLGKKGQLLKSQSKQTRCGLELDELKKQWVYMSLNQIVHTIFLKKKRKKQREKSDSLSAKAIWKRKGWAYDVGINNHHTDNLPKIWKQGRTFLNG